MVKLTLAKRTEPPPSMTDGRKDQLVDSPGTVTFFTPRVPLLPASPPLPTPLPLLASRAGAALAERLRPLPAVSSAAKSEVRNTWLW